MRTRLFFEKNKIKDNIKNDAFLKRQLEAIKADADKLMKEVPAALSYTSFKKFYTTGSRKEYEYEYFHHRRRLNDFAILAAVYDDDRYTECLQDAVWAVLDEFTWALPAHIPHDMAVEMYPTQIDLFAAETAFSLCEISAMENGLDNATKSRIEYEVRRRVIEPYLNGDKNGWETLENNWAAVCAGSVGGAMLYMASDDEIKTSLPRIKNTLACYLNGFGDDGVCVEGLNYWIYGFGYFTYFAHLLHEYSGGSENLFENEKVKNIALFPQKIYFRNNRTVNFSDCEDGFVHRRGLMCFLKGKYAEIEIPDMDTALDFDGDSCYRFAHLICDFVWSDSRLKTGKSRKCGFEYLKDSAWYIKTTEKYEFAAKAGTNNESHNHNDIASFLLNVDGKSVIADSGRGEYTAGYFSEKRYEYFAPSALAHSVPIINGRVQSHGAKRSGTMIFADNCKSVIDFKNAYDDSTLKKLERSFEFGDSKTIITDSFCFFEKPESIAEHFILGERPVDCGGVLKIGAVNMYYDKEMFGCKISEKTFATDHDKYRTVYIVDFICKNPQTETDMTFEIRI